MILYCFTTVFCQVPSPADVAVAVFSLNIVPPKFRKGKETHSQKRKSQNLFNIFSLDYLFIWAWPGVQQGKRREERLADPFL
jgi:hypothetical protein